MRKIKFSGITGPASLNEAFMRKDLLKVVSKMIPIIARKMGVKLTIPVVPQTVTDPNLGSGQFEGYRSFVNDGKDALRINFSKSGSSANVHSLSLFSDYDDSMAVKHIIIPEQFNIVQVMDHIIYALKNDYGKLGEDYDVKNPKLKLIEAESHRQHIKDWLFSGNESTINEINRRGTDWNTLLAHYLAYLRDVNARVRTPALTTFQATCRRVLDAEGRGQAADNVPHVNVSMGGPQMFITDEPSEKTFEDELVEDEHIQKFEYMKFIFQNIIDDHPRWKGVYVYGRGGIGKSHTALEMLVPQSNCYYTKGKIKGYEGLLKILFDHKDGEILVLDDIITDDDMKNTTMQNVLKGCLETGNNRFVRVHKKSGQPEREPEEIPETSEEEPPVSTANDMIDFTSATGIGGATGPAHYEDPEQDMYNFSITSAVVIITNYPKIPQPLQDRCHTIAMNFSEKQVLEIIENALEKCEPKNVDISKKVFVLDWIKERMKSRYALQPMSFRMYARVAEVYINAKEQGIDDITWQKWCFNVLRQELKNIGT